MSEMDYRRIRLDSNNEQMADTMSKSGFTFITAMYELLDNAIGAGATEIDIAFWNSNEGQRRIHEIHICDNGTGFNFGTLTKAFAMGSKKGTGMHEHGVGLKNAIAFYGNNSIREGLIGIETYDDIDAYEVIGYEVNDIVVKDIPVPEHTGSVIKINTYPLQVSMAKRLSSLLESIGVRYGNIINSGTDISVYEVDVDTAQITTDIEDNPIIHHVTAFLPPYYNPVSKTDTPFVRESFSTTDVTCELVLGVSRNELATGPWQRYSYGGGIDIVQDNRVLVHRTWLPLEVWRPKNHTSINPLIGQLIIKQGHLPTTPKKDSVQRTQIFTEVQEEVARIIRECGILKLFAEIDDEQTDYSEANMRDGLARYLRAQKMPNGDGVWGSVKTEESTDTNLSMDVTAEPDELYVFEVKKGNFNAQDMNQLIGYMITVGSRQGIVLAKTILSNAKKQFEHYWKVILDGEYNIQYWDVHSAEYKSIFDSYVGE
jgi:hypothetical protein